MLDETKEERTLTLADLNSRHELRSALKEQLKSVSSQDKALRKQLEEVEGEILECIEGVDRITVDGITYFKQKQEVINAENWDLFYEYILENKALHLLQRRVGQAATLETLEDEGEIPGIEKITITKLGARSGG